MYEVAHNVINLSTNIEFVRIIRMGISEAIEKQIRIIRNSFIRTYS